jgi:hypothetical protein
VQELRRIYEADPTATPTNIIVRSIEDEEPTTRDMGGWNLYGRRQTISYSRAANQAHTTASITYGHGYLQDFVAIPYSTTGTCTGVGLVTTTIDTSRTEANDRWNGHYITYLTGDNAGATREITDFDAASDTATHDAFANITSVGDTYKITDWAIIEDGQTFSTPVILNKDWLHLNVSGSAGNKDGYISVPSEAAGHTDALGISTITYPLSLWRYICGNATIKAKIELVFTGAEGTQVILDETNDTSWDAGSVANTTNKTIDHIRFYANDSTGDIYYDFMLACKGSFTFPNIVKMTPKPGRVLGVPFGINRGGSAIQGLGSELIYELECDLSVGNWTRTGDKNANAEVIWDIWHESHDEPWQWFDSETEQFKAVLDPGSLPRGGGEEMAILTLFENRVSTANNEYYYQRMGMDL